METLRLIVVFIHLIGFAVLFGAWAAQAFGGERRFTRLMEWGLAIAGIAGLALAAPWGLSSELNYMKIGVKLVVLIVIGGLLGAGLSRQKRGEQVPPALFWLVGLLTLANAGMALLWH